MLTFKRIHLPSGRESTGQFNATHHPALAYPDDLSPAARERIKLELVNTWNRQQPLIWKYWV